MKVFVNLLKRIKNALTDNRTKFHITFSDTEPTEDHLQVGSILHDADGRAMIITHYSVDEMLAEYID